MKKSFIKLSVFCFFLLAQPTYSSEEYIQVINDKSFIGYAPTNSSLLIAIAKKGDVFELSSEKNGWFGIYMFSGEERYVRGSDATKISVELKVPESIETRKIIFNKIAGAETRARIESEQKYPTTKLLDDIKKRVDYQRVLQDKYTLEVFHSFNLLSPMKNKIVVEGIINHW